MRFELPDAAPLRPYVITAAANRPLLAPVLQGEALQGYDPLSAADAAYCIAMNRANSYAHDDSPVPGTHATALGMPRWVMLDCCLLPSAMSGFETRREFLPADVADALDPSGSLQWLGISEYVGLPSLNPGAFVGVSLFSLVSGRSLGVRTKALGLRLIGARELTGVTQYSSPGVRVHLAFGPLEIVGAAVGVHSRPEETFVYRHVLPEPAVLDRLARGERVALPSAGLGTEELILDPRSPADRARLRALHEEHGRLLLTSAGPVEAGELSWIGVRAGGA